MLEDNNILNFGDDNEQNTTASEPTLTPADANILDFGPVDNDSSIIKVIGVGGGGGNAVNHMYREGIHDVSFVLCNTDAQALNDSPVPVHLQLGKEGLGAGNRPAVAKAAAEESLAAINHMLDDGTKMAFITAGMGGGTGTGAAPVIARESKNKGILTVGIVTIPFRFEGTKKINQALDGVEEMAKNVDALLVVNNERLRQIYPDLTVIDAFGKADDTLSVAAKSISEIITVHGLINLDFKDVQTVLKDGGVAIMSTGFGEGDGRVKKAIDDALNSPLLNDNDVFNSKKILLSISFNNDKNKEKGLMMDEMNDVNEFMEKFGDDFELKWGLANDPSLGDKIKVTILATGFGVADINEELAKRLKPSPEDLQKIKDAEEKRDLADRRFKRYYGTDGKDIQQKRTPNIFLFSARDLDNEDLILALENSPTVSRTRQKLEDLSHLSVGYSEPTEEPQQSENPTSGSGNAGSVISF